MSLDDVQLHLVNDIDTALELKRWLGERHDGELSFDTETSGLSPERDRVRLAQIGDSRCGWAIPWERWGGVFEEMISSYDGRLIAHNATFDLAMLDGENLRIDRSRVDDTMLMAHVLDPINSIALKSLATRLVDQRASVLQGELANTDWTWATVPVDYQPYWTYGAMDPVLTSQLHGVLSPRLDELSCRPAYELEVAASFVVERMERNGVPIDVEYAQAKRVEFEERTAKLAARCGAEFGCQPGQNQRIAEVLRTFGIELTEMTPGGQYKLDKEVLGDIEHPLVDLVLEHRRLTKLASTYLRHFNAELLHPSINSVGAREGKGQGVRTGRMSMDTPNFQNLPRKADASPEAIEVRNSVCAPPGHKLISCDFSQIEQRILAHLLARLGDFGLVRAFESPDDFFTAMARVIHEDPTIQKSDERRQRTKNFAYASAYGAQDAKLAITAGISMEQLQRVKTVLYPGIGAFGEQVQRAAMQRSVAEGYPYVTSFLTGRRFRPEPGAGLYVLTNYLIQGVAAELFKMKLVEMANLGLDEYMILPIHDEIILCAPDEDVADVCRQVESVMNDSTLLLAPITAEATVAQRWGEIAK